MIKILNSISKSVTGAALMISAATLVSRLIGLLRDRAFMHYFGAGPVMDAYYAAFKIPDLIYNLLIVGALTAGFIPVFTKLFYEASDPSPAWRLASNIVNLAAVILLIVCVAGVVFMPALAKIIAPGFSLANQKIMITFSRIMFFSPFLLGISMVMGGILQSLRQFVLYAIAPIFYNLGIIFGTIFLVPTRLGLNGLAWGVVLGAALHAGIQIYGAHKNGWRWQPLLNFRDKNAKLIGRLMLPRTLGLAMTQINLVVITILASLLPAGSVTVFNLANNLQAVPSGLIGIPFALAVFPILASAAGKNPEEFRRYFSATLRQIIFLIAPCAIALLILRAQFVRILWGTGEFNWAATIATANTVAFFALGLVSQAVIPLFARGFYAFHNTKTPFVISLISELISIIAALVLMRPLGVAGLALAATLGATLNAVLLYWHLRPLTGPLEGDRLWQTTLKVSLAALIMAIITQTLKYPLALIFDLDRFWGIFLQGLTTGLIGLAAYFLICYLLKLEEMVHLQASLRRKWLRLWSIPAGIDEAESL
ncbi:MAG: murein biosynthesis integral membrane protein MurJ [Candidatus Magasanikbacteria bacterium]|nr:murein biosynthesis integral membrane protein MurJ [Candidatus Magasanikbacteria bacterium]